MKTETLEQIAEKYSQRSTAHVFQEAHKQDFIAGAKWQQEQAKEMDKELKGYTEFEVLQLLLKFHQTESFDSLYEWFQQNKKQQEQ